MITNIRSAIIISLVALFGFSSCVKEKYTFGDLITPSNLTLATVVEGVDAGNPDGNGTGNVTVTATAKNVINYKIDFGDGHFVMAPSGTATYSYPSPGMNDYTVTVTAVGTGGITSTLSEKVTVLTSFKIPESIIQDLTNGSSQVWITDREADGHVGVGPASGFTPDYYSATPNQRDECLYDDEITFSKDANNNIFMTINNKGQSFLIAASTAFYGKSGGDGCYDIDNSETKKLAFMNATSGSTPDISTQIQFLVPGNGLINFGTGGNTYEILSISPTNIHLRNIGIDGNAWYQKLTVKP